MIKAIIEEDAFKDIMRNLSDVLKTYTMSGTEKEQLAKGMDCCIIRLYDDRSGAVSFRSNTDEKLLELDINLGDS